MKRKAFWKSLRRDRQLVFMLIPVVIFFAVFSYYPLYGILIAFKDYSISRGILGSPWAGLRYFRQFFSSPYFGRLLRNTVLISVYSLLWGFPIPILFALLLNEFKDGKFKRVIQTVSYLPHFISLVVICGILIDIFSPQGGVVNSLLYSLTGKRINFFGEPEWFRTMYVGSGVWQEFGWNSIIYLAAITGINPDLYEAARIDGAGRLRQIWHVTLPGIKPTILTLLILNLGNIMSVGYEKIILLYSPTTYETADVISTYVYRTGLLSQQYSYAGAVGLFNSAINIAILVLCNFAGKKLFGVGIW
ncbi:MAG TPA: ABC transporter permease subunit [Candidatus Eisenbergiella stercoravium]|uniref:ABC transporter permease subunit n=1 Tax=Candidatus Eisenbergiella intestinigallinarum TaxID=2838549 RepID=A0A9D2QJQ0_9FIRM|nr:ABC transporter permease subunit [Candidatus Eisenbergiella stercoravium]HJC87880.1 ABC transporter permease subunit [Candidatus Eisenbergiella intestinigallinarum]